MVVRVRRVGSDCQAGESGALWKSRANILQKSDQPGRIDHFCIGVDDFDAERLRTRVKSAGIEGVQGNASDNFSVSDPDGLRVQVWAFDQPSAWQIKSMVVRPLDPSGWKEAKQVSIERLERAISETRTSTWRKFRPFIRLPDDVCALTATGVAKRVRP